jgi:hypothetical protein
MPTRGIYFQQIIISALPVRNGSPLAPKLYRVVGDIRHIDREILAAQVAITAQVLFHSLFYLAEAPAGSIQGTQSFRVSGNQSPP